MCNDVATITVIYEINIFYVFTAENFTFSLGLTLVLTERNYPYPPIFYSKQASELFLQQPIICKRLTVIQLIDSRICTISHLKQIF
jgi:hypothetical protein